MANAEYTTTPAPQGTLTRRNALLLAPAALAAAALPVAAGASAGTVQERVDRLMAEIFAVLSETVPEGTVLTTAMTHDDTKGRKFVQLVAKRPGQAGEGAPYWFGALDRPWEFHPGSA